MKTFSSRMTADELEAYKHEKAGLVMQALRAGKAVREIFGQTNIIDPSTLHFKESGRAPKRYSCQAIWTRESVNAYKVRFPEWGNEFDRLSKASAEARKHLKGAHKRNLTHCKRGHPLSGDNLKLEPQTNGKWIFRRCLTCHRVANSNPPMPSPEAARKVLDGLRSGLTMSAMTMPRSADYIMNFEKLKVLRSSNRKLDKFIVNLSAKNARPRWLASVHKFRTTIATPALSRSMSVLDTIAASIPQYVMDADRQDIIADMWTAVAEGKLKPSDIKAQVNRFLSAHRKMYQTTDRWGPKSLDAPAYLDSPVSLVETLRDDQGLWR